MTTMLVAFNGTRENGNFMGDQLCALKAAYLFVQNQPDVDRVVFTASPGNEMHFVWSRFLADPRGDGSVPPADVVFDDWDPGDWSARFAAWDAWRAQRCVDGSMDGDGKCFSAPFDHYRELYLRIHGALRQNILCGHERGLGRRNIYEYWYYGQEHLPESCVGSDVYDVEIDHPPHRPTRDVYVSPHCKTQGNYTFTFDYWDAVVRKLVDAGVSVTVGYDGPLCEDLVASGNPLYRKHWGTHGQWVQQVCSHKVVACGNTGTGWLAAACGVPLLTMEPPNSQMPDHRYRECGLRNLIGVLSEPDADYCALRLIEEVRRKLVLTTGCYDVLHAGHVRHLERARAMGSRLVVALNSDESVRRLKGPGRPINPQAQRKAVLEAIRWVDEVRVFDGDDACPLIEELRPAVLACGFGYTVDTVVGRALLDGWSGRAAVTCAGDAKDEPSTTKVVRRMERAERERSVVELCRAAESHSVNPYDKLKVMADEFLSVVDLDGDVADLGSCRGGTALVLRRLAPGKHLHLFDTWEGNPHDDDMCHHKQGEWKASLTDCKAVVGGDGWTHYHQGVFPTYFGSCPADVACTTRTAEDRTYCFVYVDMDTYQSTRDAIAFFWPRMVPGGKVVFDDYGWEPCAGVKVAVDEMFPPDECERYADFGAARRRVFPANHTCVVEMP